MSSIIRLQLRKAARLTTYLASIKLMHTVEALDNNRQSLKQD